MANPVLQQNGGYSIAAAGARMGAGQGGLYIKTQAAVLYDGPGAIDVTHPLIITSTVRCPSARIRVAFGVGGKDFFLRDGDTAPVGDFGIGTYWNAIPFISVPNVKAPAAGGGGVPDASPVIAGRPIFWMSPAAGVDNAPPHAETSNANAPTPGTGFTAQSGWNSESNLLLQQYGRAVPDAYEVISSADLYKVYLFITNIPAGRQLPIMIWARWEILDPRNEEDTVELMSKCVIEAPSTVTAP
jgi:hypothetical protein